MKINEIFYSLQGEGRNAGRAAVFIRLSGCNLKCPFCDTQHQSGYFMSEREVLKKVLDCFMAEHCGMAKSEMPIVVLTGGEPTIQDCYNLIALLHSEGFGVAIETNGTRNPTWLKEVDFITLSPKFAYVQDQNAEIRLKRCDELKVVYKPGLDLSRYDNIKAKYRYLQPCDTGDKAENEKIIKDTIEQCKFDPRWRLSLQTQKIVGIL